MQFVRAIYMTAVLGFALASGLYAQHGGGGHAGSSGGHAGNVGSHAGPSVTRGAAAPSTGLNLGGRPYPVRTDIPVPVGLNPPASAYTGILPGALKPINGYGNRHSRFYPGFVAPPLFLPGYWDAGFSSFSGFDNSAPPADPNAQALTDSQDALAQQIQQLTAEVQQMKSNQQQPQAPPPEPTTPSAAPERRPPTPPVTLILRDGQQLSVENYAVMNETFWNFSKRPVQKIPISSIDLAASAKATEANGGEFPQVFSAQ